MLGEDRQNVAAHATATVSSVRLFEQLPKQPIITLAKAIEILGVSKPTALKAIDCKRRLKSVALDG